MKYRNYETARFYYDLGVRRVVLAKELGLKDIIDIRKNVPLDLEIEAFVHGGMVMSYSGRRLLSNYTSLLMLLPKKDILKHWRFLKITMSLLIDMMN